MNEPIEVVGFSDPAGVGFVKEVVTYTIMDDLKVAPLSAVSVITLLKALGVADISSLQEMTVRVGYAEGLEMLRASLQSEAVLTDVFLRKKNMRQQAVAAPSNKKRKLKATVQGHAHRRLPQEEIHKSPIEEKEREGFNLPMRRLRD
ncbi:uncharacterized protein [Miscanthus floridulus]|uniref:uncharacterized protein n=1 Tax=Miscanthus floridulus TaxID=154761 RepID=UPI003459DEEB